MTITTSNQTMPLRNKILIESSKEVKFRTIKATFGDGYSQRAPDGLNSKITLWNVTWGGLTLTELNELETFLDAKGGHAVITWIPCGETIGKKFINAEGRYSRTRVGSVYSVTVALEEVFDA